MPNAKIEYEESSGNIFKDLGFPNPEEHLVKARLASIIYDIIVENGLTHGKAAKILGIKQSKVSALLNGRLADFSLDLLFSLLRKLVRDIEIVVSEKAADRSAAEIRVSMPV